MKKYKLFENDLQYSKEERRAFLESIRRFTAFKEHIYRRNSLQQISEELGQMIESAQAFTLKETDKWFDNITVNRDMKSIQDNYKVFQKTCNEITQLQQRLESCYENIGQGLGRYYEL